MPTEERERGPRAASRCVACPPVPPPRSTGSVEREGDKTVGGGVAAAGPVDCGGWACSLSASPGARSLGSNLNMQIAENAEACQDDAEAGRPQIEALRMELTT